MKNLKLHHILSILALLAFNNLFHNVVFAEEGFYLGIGVAQQSISGPKFNGETKFLIDTDSETEVVLIGELTEGYGYSIDIGYGITDYLSFEYWMVETSHKSDSDSSLEPSGEKEAQLKTYLVGLSLSFRFFTSHELELKLGAGRELLTFYDYYINCDGSCLQSNFVIANRKPIQLSTSITLSYGFGYSVYLENVELSLLFKQKDSSFDQIDVKDGDSYKIDDLTATINTLVLGLAYHF